MVSGSLSHTLADVFCIDQGAEAFSHPTGTGEEDTPMSHVEHDFIELVHCVPHHQIHDLSNLISAGSRSRTAPSKVPAR